MSKINKKIISPEKKVTNNSVNKIFQKKQINNPKAIFNTLNKIKRPKTNNQKIRADYFNFLESLLTIDYFFEDNSSSIVENKIKGKRYVKNKKGKPLRYIIIAIKILIFLLQIFSSKLKYSSIFQYAKISLKIKGTGEKY